VTDTHITPSQTQGAALVRRFGMTGGPIFMLNLLRFRDMADYSHAPDLAPAKAITGAEAYARYEAAISPLLDETGGAIVFDGLGGDWFIGPEAAHWHRVLIVRQTNLTSFFSFASRPDAILAGHHRTAALADSRLLPMTAQPPLALAETAP